MIKLLNKILVCFSLMLSFSIQADLGTTTTVPQLTDDVRAYLKKAHLEQVKYFSANAVWPTTLLATPKYLQSFGVARKRNVGSGFIIEFVSNATSILNGKIISINNNGVIGGAGQFATVDELVTLINSNLLTIHTLETAYYADFNTYTNNLTTAGYVLPTYLSPYLTLSVTSTPTTFTATFTGKIFPLVGRVFTIKQNKALTGF